MSFVGLLATNKWLLIGVVIVGLVIHSAIQFHLINRDGHFFTLGDMIEHARKSNRICQLGVFNATVVFVTVALFFVGITNKS